MKMEIKGRIPFYLTALVVIGLLAYALADVYRKMPVADPETLMDADDRMQCWRKGAEAAARKELSNEVVGITRIVEVHVSTWGDAVQKWKAEGVAERMNEVGGIERTNLPLRFWATRDQVFALKDYEELARRWKAALDAKYGPR